MEYGYTLLENLGKKWEARRIQNLSESLERVARELTNGVSPPYSEYTHGVLHDFDEVHDRRFERSIYFD